MIAFVMVDGRAGVVLVIVVMNGCTRSNLVIVVMDGRAGRAALVIVVMDGRAGRAALVIVVMGGRAGRAARVIVMVGRGAGVPVAVVPGADHDGRHGDELPAVGAVIGEIPRFVEVPRMVVVGLKSHADGRCIAVNVGLCRDDLHVMVA